jgi:hypothetical protein
VAAAPGRSCCPHPRPEPGVRPGRPRPVWTRARTWSLTHPPAVRQGPAVRGADSCPRTWPPQGLWRWKGLPR